MSRVNSSYATREGTKFILLLSDARFSITRRGNKCSCIISVHKQTNYSSSFSYRSRVDLNLIEYRKFCDEIESIFTTDFLEKNPLVDSEQYVAIKDATNIRLEPDKEDRVKNVMSKLAERVS